jgi:hypothetical protein
MREGGGGTGAGNVSRMGDMKGAYMVFVGKREGSVLLGKHRHR